jgi:hypothetical protein
MKKSAHILFSLVFIFCVTANVFSQGIGIGEWRAHLPWNSCISVTEGDGIVYCATKFAVFSFDKNDNSLQRLTKVNSLSDIGVSRVAYHKGLKVLVVAYTDGNIDLIENNTATNMPDIKNKPIPGIKSINNILFVGNYAYLSCGFGIVVLDVQKKEIKDTYYIGLGGAHIQVYDMTTDGTKLYAATEDGIFDANINDPNLSNYVSWQHHAEMAHPDSKYNCICYFNDTLYANYSSEANNSDTTFQYAGGVWQYFHADYPSTKCNIRTFNNELVVVNTADIFVYDTNGTEIEKVWTYNPGVPSPRDAVIDEDNSMWIADNYIGLVKGWNIWNYLSVQPNGPLSNKVVDMSVEGSNLWAVSGGYDGTWNNLYNHDGFYTFINEQWTTYNSGNVPVLDSIYDVVCTQVNPANPSQAFIGTWSGGLFQFDNQSLTHIYNEKNSTLRGTSSLADTLSGLYRCRVGGIVFDSDGNMWVTNSNSSTNTALNVRTPSGVWKSYDFSGYLTKDNAVGDLVIDKFNQKWIVLPRNVGLAVFNDNNTLSNTADDKIKKITNATGNGALPSNNVYSIAVDLDGEIWVGTDKGVAVFYSPENVFSGSNFDAQQILVDQGGFIQPLLQSEVVTCIAVDGANRKWIGTERAGVFLMSADGTKQILNFTEDNCPLLSNTISSIAIDGKTGEVFFGTDKGIISYKSDATKGEEVYTDVTVYPNPVRENYDGYIAIKGLVANADIKITDITGTLIYKTVAEGGEATWNGKNFSGEKAQTGIYLVFCSNADGSETLVTKIMFIN